MCFVKTTVEIDIDNKMTKKTCNNFFILQLYLSAFDY